MEERFANLGAAFDEIVGFHSTSFHLQTKWYSMAKQLPFV